MPSPFPGMDPYLEPQWTNFHVLMIGALAGVLKRSLPPGLQARPEEDVSVEVIAGERLRGFRPDVAVVEPALKQSSQAAGGTAAVAEPIRLAYRRGSVVRRNIQIVDTNNGGRVVTAIEVLSPWNKLPGDLNRKYRAKLKSYEEAGINWVEIDLLRSSRKFLPVPWHDIPKSRRSNYLVVVYRAVESDLLAYPVSIRGPLPPISVPLRATDAGARLDLQMVFGRVLDDGPFDLIDYSIPPDPPLAPDDAAWAAEMIARPNAV